jgi:hypothetical protein
MIHGRDLINPLRHLSDTTMVPGLSLQFDVAGPWLVKTKSKQASMETRQEKRRKGQLQRCGASSVWTISPASWRSALWKICSLEPCPQPSKTSSPSTSGRLGKSQDTSRAVADQQDEEEANEEEIVDI